MKKILSIIQTPVFGGPHNQMLRLLNPLANEGIEQVVVLADGDGDGKKRLAEGGVRVISEQIPRLRKSFKWSDHSSFIFDFFGTIKRLEQIIQREDPDVVQICGLMSIHGAIAAHRVNKPIMWQLLGTFAPKPLRYLLMKFVIKYSDCVMSAGMETAYQHPGWCQLKKRGVRLIPFFPPVDTSSLTPCPIARERGRAILGVSPDDLVVGTIGNRNRSKNHGFLVAIAKKFKNKKRWRFRVYGKISSANKSEYRKNVEIPLIDAKLHDDHFFEIDELQTTLHETLAAFDVFVLTSMAEGAPTAMLEAMSVGKPIVSTNVGSVPQILTENTGFVIRQNDVNGFTEALAKLGASDSLRAELGDNARLDAVENYDIINCLEAHLEAYRAAIENRQNRPA